MSVSYQAILSQSVSLSSLGHYLENYLLAAGWTLENGIFDWNTATPATTYTLYCTRIYKMNDSISSTYPWYFRIDWMTGNSTTQLQVQMQTGTGYTSGDVVDNAGTTFSFRANSNAIGASGDTYIASYESGWCMMINCNGSQEVFGIERTRTFTGVIQDPIMCFYAQPAGSSGTYNGWFNYRNVTNGLCAIRDRNTGESGRQWVILANASGISSGSPTIPNATYSRPDNASAIGIGPFIAGATLFGTPRTFQLVSTVDVPSGATQSLIQDGVSRIFQATSLTPLLSNARYLIATE